MNPHHYTLKAPTGDLSVHLHNEEVQDRINEEQDAMVEQKAKDLMQPNCECDPFLPENFREAIAQMDKGNLMVVTSFLHTVNQLPDNDISKHMASDTLIRFVNEYWFDVAKYVVRKDMK